MCSKSRIKRHHTPTGLVISRLFTVCLLVASALLLLLVDRLLASSLIERDQQLIDARLQNYVRIAHHAGIDKLHAVLEQERDYLVQPQWQIELSDPAQRTLLTIAAEPPLEGNAQQRSVRFDEGTIRVGLSAAQQQQELSAYRGLMLALCLPLITLCLGFIWLLSRRTLRPIEDLIQTVEQLEAHRLQARVPVRDPRSELGQLSALFNNLLERIDQLMQAMRGSLDAIAHDLRTPMARMRLSIEKALTGPQSVPRLQEALYDCAEESEQIEALLRSMVAVSEAESGLMQLKPSRFALASLVDEVIELYQYPAEDKAIAVSSTIDAHLEAHADRLRLKQALCNLLDNAIKYSEEGGTVTLNAALQEDQLCIEVIDEGIGIAAEDRPHVFERLYRADKSRSEPGLGLGLALVKAIIEAHQGRITLPPTPTGTRVTLALPQPEP